MKRKNKKPEFSSYLFEITKTEISYSFGLDHSNHPQGPYQEHLALEISGVCKYPKKIKNKKFEFYIMGNRAHEAILRKTSEIDYKPLAVGKLTAKGERFSFLGSLPYSTIWDVYPLLKDKRLRLVRLHGNVIKYGRAPIMTVNFLNLIDEDDFDFLD